MDRPASVTAAILGVALIAITIPYFLLDGSAGGQEYSITWSEAASASGQAASGPGSGSSATAEARVTDRLPSTAVIRFSPCVDGATPPLTQPASISWTLFEGDEQKGQGTAGCNNSGPFEVELDAQPDVASVEASSADEARRLAYEAGDNETATFRLVFSWTRSGGLPLGPQPPFAATGQLEIREWRATANLPAPEAPR